MAAGDILSVTITPDGWSADVLLEGMAPGAGYDFDLDEFNNVGVLAPRFTVVSEGYDATGTLGTVTRTVWATTVLRQAYPNNALLQETDQAGNLLVRVALSDHVFADDRAGGAGTSGTDPLFTAPSGWVTSGAVSSAVATGLPVTNSSALPYPKVIANWSRPDRDRLAAPSVTLGALAFHGYASGGRPVAAVKFTASNGTQTATATVADPVIDSSYGDPAPVIEYLATLNLTGFTDDTLVTCDFVAYPPIGDETAVLDTAALAQDEITGQTPRQYYVLDVDGSRGYPIVVVSPTGDDARTYTTSVKPSDTQSNRDAAALVPVATLGRAVRLLYEHNNAVNGRANPMGGTIYLDGGGTLAVMGTIPSTPVTVVGNMWTWTTVTPLPGGTEPELVPDATTGNREQLTKGMKWQGLTQTRTTDAYWFRGAATARAIAVDCTISDTRASNTYASMSVGVGSLWLVRCQIDKVISQGARHYYRGCSFTTGYPLSQLRTVIAGCDFTWAYAGVAPILANPSQQSTDAEGAILAFNRMWKLTKPLASLFSIGTTAYARGVAIVQNLVEGLNLGGQQLLGISMDGTTTSTTGNIISNNTLVGQRANLYYNDRGTAATPHTGHSVSLNAFEYYAHKGDVFNDTVNGPQGARTGGWSIDNGVRNHGNRMVRGEFDQRFRGLRSYGGTSQVTLDLGYTDDRSGTAGLGGGDYRPTVGSVLGLTGVSAMLPYDLDGQPRNIDSDTAGAYALAIPELPDSGLVAVGGTLTGVGGVLTAVG